MLMTQSKQKSYMNNHQKDFEFMVGDKVFFRVSPMKGLKRFGKKEKLSPRYVKLLEILKGLGKWFID